MDERECGVIGESLFIFHWPEATGVNDAVE